MGTEKSSVSESNTKKATAEEIEADIHKTRERMDRTVEELSERLQSFHFIDDAMDFVRYVKAHTDEQDTEVLVEAGRQTIRRIVTNPLPSALIAAGVAWLLIRGEKTEPVPFEREPMEPVPGFEYRGDVPSTEGIEASEAERIREEGREKTEDEGFRIRDKRSIHDPAARETEGGIRHGAEKIQHRVVETIQKHPLAVGVGAIALGILGGFALPHGKKKEFIPAETEEEARLRSEVEASIFRSAAEAEERARQVRESAMEAAGRKDELPQDDAGSAAARVRETSLEGTGTKTPKAL